jgi:hypothetical protein
MLVAVLAICASLVQAQSKPRCLSEGLPPEGKRLAKPAFKGMELYSWRAADRSMSFSLLWGTNRPKTGNEIKSPACVLADTGAVKAMFSRLAKGEHVFWMWTSAGCPDCTYPPQKEVDTLLAHAKQAAIVLDLGARPVDR